MTYVSEGRAGDGLRLDVALCVLLSVSVDKSNVASRLRVGGALFKFVQLGGIKGFAVGKNDSAKLRFGF